MCRAFRSVLILQVLSATVLAVGSGCTSFRDYVHHGFKVGPEVGPSAPAMPCDWIDVADRRLSQASPDLSKWWTVFNDPVLDGLIADAYRQNLGLREAAFRVLQARAQVGIAVGGLFPQSQYNYSGYKRVATSGVFSDAWSNGFTMAWEIDFWGRLRRTVEAAQDNLDASVEDYDNVLVTLLGDVAIYYATVRVAQQEIELAKANAQLQRAVLEIIQARMEAGRVSELDVDQQLAILKKVEAQIPLLQATARQAQNRLCILMGVAPVDIYQRLGMTPIPSAPTDAVVGVPAELLVRRPDVRQAQYLAAAQAQKIGIAQADFYPYISLTGTIGYSATNLGNLFDASSLNGSFGPTAQWNILNYGRILNTVRYHDAKFDELVLKYHETVISAAKEVEDGIITFLRAQERVKVLTEAVDADTKAVDIVINQYRTGTVDFNRVATLEQSLVTDQDSLAVARGTIVTGLVNVYRALGGGWQIRLANPNTAGLVSPPHATEKPELIKTPAMLDTLTGDGDAKNGKDLKRDPVPVPPPPAVPEPNGARNGGKNGTDRKPLPPVPDKAIP